MPDKTRQGGKDGERDREREGEVETETERARGKKLLTPPFFSIFTHFSIASLVKAEKAHLLLQAATLNQRQIWSAASH